MSLEQEKKHWVRLTRACNNKCIFCLDYNSHNNTFYSYPYISKKIRQGYDSQTKSRQRLILSGGEPTINPDFIKAIISGKKIGFDKIQVITNGRMFYYNNFIQEAKKAGLDEITFSIHGHNSKLHDELTGVTGSFEQVSKGLENALNLDFIVNIDIVINKKNYKEIMGMIKFFHNKGVTEFDLLTIMPYGRAWDMNFEKLFYDLNDFKSEFSKVIEYGKDNELFIWYNRFPVNYFEDNEDLLIDIDKKLYYEIFGERKGKFQKALDDKKTLNCFNSKRCRYCYLNDFCKQLFAFADYVNKGKSSVKIFTVPFCLGSKNYKEIKLSEINKKGKLDLNNFFKFFINNLHFYKSVRCEACVRTEDCLGLDYNSIKEKGFKILKPIPKG